MVDQTVFSQVNLERIQAVESLFGPSGKALVVPGRHLVGEGRLLKLSRRGPQAKVFFLFSDILVYGSIVLHGRWYKNQQIIPLEDIQLEDLEDGLRMKNQWLIRTPRKSFYVGASTCEEKQAWMKHIEECRANRLQDARLQPNSNFAVTWVPDQASAICMRCSDKFSTTNRRHHCRRCGFVVCNACSKYRAVIPHIHPGKPLRVCKLCHSSLLRMEEEALANARLRGDSVEKNSSEDEITADDTFEEEVEDAIEAHAPSKWMDY